MRIGITYDLRIEAPARAACTGGVTPPVPDDFQEEFDSPATIESIAGVLRGLGHEVDKLGDGRGLLERLLAGPPDLVNLLASAEKVWIQTHFNHPREVTPEAARVCKALLRAGMPVNNHTVLLKGVNDSLETMRELLRGQRVS